MCRKFYYFSSASLAPPLPRWFRYARMSVAMLALMLVIISMHTSASRWRYVRLSPHRPAIV